MKITSQRFVLRDFLEEDRSAFVRFQSDPELLARYGSEDSAPGHAESLFQRFMLWSSEAPRRMYQLGIFRISDPSALMGCCGLRGNEDDEKRAEMGISFAPQYWGRHGYAAEIVDTLLEFGFAGLGLAEISGSTAARNNQVARLASWFGATQSGSFTASIDRELPQTDWRISRKLWEARKNRRRRWAQAIQIELD